MLRDVYAFAGFCTASTLASRAYPQRNGFQVTAEQALTTESRLVEGLPKPVPLSEEPAISRMLQWIDEDWGRTRRNHDVRFQGGDLNVRVAGFGQCEANVRRKMEIV